MTSNTAAGDVHKAAGDVVPPQEAGRIAHEIGVGDDSGWCQIVKARLRGAEPGPEHATVLGDAAIAASMPKSAFAAEQPGEGRRGHDDLQRAYRLAPSPSPVPQHLLELARCGRHGEDRRKLRAARGQARKRRGGSNVGESEEVRLANRKKAEARGTTAS